jgi:tetratricopeptide (TPR) repeat protein
MRGFVGRVLAALSVIPLAQPADAGWHKATTPHFVIYSDQNPERLRAYAAQLEKFDQAVRFARRTPDYDIGDGNRLTIFVTRNTSGIQRLAGSDFVAGFYIGHASGPVAFVPRSTNDRDFSADVVFFHEYAHHMMLQDLDRPIPEWLVEGFAEFMSTATFEKDGRVALGRAANHRALGLIYTEGLPLETLLAGSYARLTEIQRESVYGKGWLLTHYLTFSDPRKGQLEAYINAISTGVPALDAARKAFGDLRQLDRDLDKYLKQRTILTLFIGAGQFKPVAVDVEPLSAGAAEAIALRMESRRGVNAKTAEPLAAKIRRVQSKYPGDVFVELTLAEAELDSGHPEAAEAAADRALKSDPKSIEAMIYKGRAMGARAAAMKEPDPKLFAESRNWYLKANALDSEDPEPLYEFYRSFVEEGVQPNKNAVEALHYASNLAPQDMGVRMMSAMQYLRDRDLKRARKTLEPIAYNPHSDGYSTIAKAMMVRVDAGDAEGAIKTASTDSSDKGASGN